MPPFNLPCAGSRRFPTIVGRYGHYQDGGRNSEERLLYGNRAAEDVLRSPPHLSPKRLTLLMTSSSHFPYMKKARRSTLGC